MPRALLLLGCMVRVRVLARPASIPLVGSPALPFIDKGGGVGIYRWGKRKNTKSVEGPLRDPSLPSSPLKALVWFWLIDETLSANLVYQDDYEIGSTTPSDEAMTKIMTMVMAW